MRGRRAAQRQQRSALRGQASASPTPEASTSTTEMGTRFQMRQQIFTIGQDFWIENDRRQRVFKVDGKALRVRGTLFFEDRQGRQLYKIQERLARVRDTMVVQTPGDGVAARVHNALITPLRDRWQINIPGGQDLFTQGNILHHQYQIRRGGTTVARISRRWFRVRDTYGVEVAPNEDACLMLAITVVIDMMAHPGR